MILKFKNLLVLLFTLTLSLANAQDITEVPTNEDTVKTLLSNFKLKSLGLFIAPEVQSSQFAKEWTTQIGASAMILVNNKWAFGVNSSRTTGNFMPSTISSAQDLRMRVMQIGGKIEYVAAQHKLIHISIPVIAGVGFARVDSINGISNIEYYDNDRGHGRNYNNRSSADFINIQPGLNLEVNVFKYGKIFLGGSYRIPLKINNDTNVDYVLTKEQVGGLNIHLGAKFGLFSYKFK